MGPLVAAGGVVVDADAVGGLETVLNKLCQIYGFPPGEEFKWSPNPKSWMHGNLVADQREQFFAEVLDEARAADVTAVVAIEDRDRQVATRKPTHELDVVAVCLERIDNVASSSH